MEEPRNSCKDFPDPAGLRWLSNCPAGDYDPATGIRKYTHFKPVQLKKGLIIGEPNPTADVNIEQLKEMGYVGLYSRV